MPRALLSRVAWNSGQSTPSGVVVGWEEEKLGKRPRSETPTEAYEISLDPGLLLPASLIESTTM